MCTKGGKTIETWFFPVGEEIEQIVVEWVRYLQTDKLLGGDDLVFQRTKNMLGHEGGFQAAGLDRQPWRTAEPVQRVFRAAFQNAGLPSFNPHSFRQALARYGERVCRTPEEFKAWSQNLGHKKVLTTFSSYGKVEPHRQGELIGAIRARPAVVEDGVSEKLVDAVFRRLLKAKPEAALLCGDGE